MQKRKFKRFGAVLLIVAMIVTMFSTVSASAGTSSGTNSAVYKHTSWYLRSPHRFGFLDENGVENVDGYAPALYTLVKKGADPVGVYCCDLVTSAIVGTYYVRTNLEDALVEDDFNEDNELYAYYTAETAA